MSGDTKDACTIGGVAGRLVALPSLERACNSGISGGAMITGGAGGAASSAEWTCNTGGGGATLVSAVGAGVG